MATKKYLKKEAMTQEQLELYERGFSFDDDGKIVFFNANFFAKYIEKYYDIIFASDDKFYDYQEGVWIKMDDNDLKSFLYQEIEAPRKGVWTSQREYEYLLAMKRYLYKKKEFNAKRHLINMKNGMFDTVKLKLIEHHPKYLSTIQIPIEYSETATCQRFDVYLEEVFEGDQERITKAIEWLGYCITAETIAQKALVLFGGGSNGKGVYTDVLSRLVGKDNLAHIPLNELGKGFSRATLFGKTVNISSENEMGGKSFNTQYFKNITGEDTITAEFKNQPVFSFKPTAKMVLSMNNLPQTKDKSVGYSRRLDFLLFSRHFTEEEIDRDLKMKLEKELSGIFNRAISGLVKLRHNKFEFSHCESSNKVLDEYMQELNPMIGFFDECLEEADANYKEDNKKMYESFKQWAQNNGHSGYANISNQRFWREFDSIVKSRKWVVVSGRSNKFRFHKGVKLVEDGPEPKKKIIKKHSKSNATNELFESDEDGVEIGQRKNQE